MHRFLQEREKDRLRFQRPPDSGRDFDRGTVAPSRTAQDSVGGAMGVMNMAGGVVGGSLNMNLASSGNTNIQLLNQLGIDPAGITNQVFVANVSNFLSKYVMKSESFPFCASLNYPQVSPCQP